MENAGETLAPTVEAVNFLNRPDDLPVKSPPNGQNVPEVASRTNNLSGMGLEALLRLRAEVDALLPATSLKDMDLEEELVVQFLAVKTLQTTVLEDMSTPANQKAQVAGQVAATLQQLVKMQAEYHTAERFKTLENLMIKALKRMPVEAAEAFLEEYENLG